MVVAEWAAGTWLRDAWGDPSQVRGFWLDEAGADRLDRSLVPRGQTSAGSMKTYGNRRDPLNCASADADTVYHVHAVWAPAVVATTAAACVPIDRFLRCTCRTA
uniref:Uncharacterized protein n=1 Tax=Oryza sativa subsp. japonica TaxID=39947 RepID=Q6H682_ORYSJ|nr:hypothetical protein [Oryza sativa Japonica Group]